MPKSYFRYAFIAFLVWLIIQLVSAYYVAREKAALDQVSQYQIEIGQSKFAKPPGLMAPVPLSTLSTPPTVPSAGWSDIYTEDFENGFFDDADCHTYAYNTQTGMPRDDYSWGRTSLNPPVPHSGTFAAWPAAATQRASINAYPDHFYTDVVCTFTGLEEADNLMVEFWTWQDSRNEDYLFVGFNTQSEPVQPGLEMIAYPGVAWQETSAVVDGHDSPQWEKRRLYLLRDQGDLRLPDHGVVHVVWRFASPTANQAAAQGAFIDDVRIAQYRKDPGLGDRCSNPASPEQPIGKGVSLPPFISSVYNREAATIDPAQLLPMVENLQGVNAKWVRLEFTVPVSAYAGFYSRTLINETAPTIDLEHYDLMIDALCQGGVGILGLIDYDTFVDESWRESHRFSPAYLEKFVNRTAFLADYYRDRIDHWQIWNEPDLPPEGETDVPHQIEPDSYAQLLVQVYQQLRNPTVNPNIDPNDRVLLGGLSSVNRSDDPTWGYGYDYLAALYEAVPPQNMPFYDILALHPYPGAQASHSTNPLQNPARYLYSKSEERESDGPTLIHKFQNLIYRKGDWAGKLYQPFIWITELGWRRGREERSKIGFDCESLRPRLSYEFQQFDYLYDSLDTLFGETHWLDQGRLNEPAGSRALILTDRPGISTVIWHEYQDSSEWLDCVPFAGNSTPDLPIMLPTWPRSFDEIWAEREATPPDRQIVGWWWGLYNGDKAINPVGCALRDYPDPVVDPACQPRDRAMLDQPIYVPRVAGGNGTYTTQIRLANLEHYRATSLLKAYNSIGEIVADIDDLIAPGGTKNYHPVEDIPVGFDGALTFWTDSRVPAVINLWANDLTSGAAFVGQREASRKLYLPALMAQHDGANSWVSIQNAGDATAQVLVEYSDGTRAQSVIPAGASSLFDQALEDHRQTLFAATATSDQPLIALAVQADQHGMAAYNGLTQGMTRPALPHIRGNDGGMNSTIYLQNVGDQSTDVTVVYTANPATAGPGCQRKQSI